MKTPGQHFGFNRKLLTLTLLVAFGPAHAEDDDVAQYIKPDSAVIGVGVGVVSGDSKDRTIFGQYNGLRKNDANLLLDFDYVRRDDARGLWTTAEGRNIGLDNRELRFSQQLQGDWKYLVEYSELVRHDPRTINTALQGSGTSTPQVVSLAATGTGADINLDTKRQGLKLSGEKWLAPNLLFELSFKNEDKKGSRLSGIGNYCSNIIGSLLNTCTGTTGALLLLPMPTNTTTRQFEAKLSYSGDTFAVNGGYYGSFFTNSNGSVVPGFTGNLVNPAMIIGATPGSEMVALLGQPLALPPDNQAHQVYVAGNYAFSPTTRATFKYAYTHATQDDSFGGNGLTGAPAGASNLGGVVDSTLAQVGFTARPDPKLSLLANWRYEEHADKTPYSVYASAMTSNSSKKVNGKVEGTYQLPDNFRATLGVDYAWVRRDRPTGTAVIPATSLAGLREDTEELAYRAELKRSMSETLNASLAYTQSQRDGYQWRSIAAGYPYVSNDVIAASANATLPVGNFPMTMVDRQRDKWKVAADWTPVNEFSVQLMFEDGADRYQGPVAQGLRDSGMRSYGFDAAWTVSDAWKLTGYLNQGKQTLRVSQNPGYTAVLDDSTTSVGIGVIGKPSGKLEVGGDLSYLDDRNSYNQTMGTGAAIVNGLPDVTYRVTSLKLFGKYAIEKNADIRVELVHQRAKFNEWTWGANGIPFAYSDNTTVTMQANQSVTFIGARYIYNFK